MYRGQRIAVVMPAYNVQDHVGRAIATIPSFVDRLYVVDDASVDATAARARSAAAGAVGVEARLTLICRAQNGGVGAAIASGYKQALADEADVVAVMAGDAQMDPADLAPLCDAVIDGADYAKGNRFRHPDVWRAMPRARIVGNIGLSLLTKLSSGYWRSFDSQCGYTAIGRAALAAVLAEGFFSRYGYVNDLLARLGAFGARVVDVSVRPIYDDEPSGVRLSTVFHPILSVLMRSLSRRLWRRHLAPLLVGRARPKILPEARRAPGRADHLLPAQPD
ncbi:MAG: glycosyltransferase family 2 protein [Myxococcales bacterium]|nr:glycosyltransferase family 2 protein [Myxococcales bacterium]